MAVGRAFRAWTSGRQAATGPVPPTNAIPRTARREFGIDALRYLGAFAVVVLHALPIVAAPVPLWLVMTGAACVPAVPIFFMVSGYFMRPADRVSLVLRPLRRLVPIYVFWVFAYFVLLHIIPLREWSFPPNQWLWGGTAYHLWFLPALALALVFVGLSLDLIGVRLTGVACAALAAYALARGAYHDVLHLPGAAAGRNEQYAGPLYVYIGVMLARWPVRIAWWWMAGLVVAVYFLVVGEQQLIAYLAGEPQTVGHDVIISVFAFSAVLLLFARALPDSALVRALAWLGRISLGVYVIHLFLVWLMLQYLPNRDLLQVISLSLVVLAAATLLSLVLQRIPGLRPLVR